VSPDPDLSFFTATEADVDEIYALRCAVAARLTRDHGKGHWSSVGTTKGVRHDMRTSRMVLARSAGALVGTLRLGTRKPWAIDVAYFTAVRQPLYLTGMLVGPDRQGRGIGRRLIEEALALARAWPSEALRLDAYEAEAGAGGFYAKCGFREVGRVRYRTVPLIYFEMLL
jgi:GNAT superfamily N-acetyltransferase